MHALDLLQQAKSSVWAFSPVILSAGSTLSDVTEAIGLDADSQTLDGGSIADLMAVQVSKGLSVVKEYFVPLLLQ